MLSELTNENRKYCSREVGNKMELKVSSIARMFMLRQWHVHALDSRVSH